MCINWLRKLADKCTTNRTRHQRRVDATRARLSMGTLEVRDVPATANLTGADLTVAGLNAGDTVVVSSTAPAGVNPATVTITAPVGEIFTTNAPAGSGVVATANTVTLTVGTFNGKVLFDQQTGPLTALEFAPPPAGSFLPVEVNTLGKSVIPVLFDNGASVGNVSVTEPAQAAGTYVTSFLGGRKPRPTRCRYKPARR